MALKIELKRSSVPGKVPTTTELALGELAINTYDGKLFLKKNVSGAETIVDISSGSGNVSFATSASFAATASFLLGSISNAVSASYALTASFALNAGGGSTIDTGSFATTSSLNAYTSSINSYTSSINAATSSFVKNSQTSSMTVLSSSYALTASFALNAGGGSTTDTGSFVTTSSFNAYTASVTQSIVTATVTNNGSNYYIIDGVNQPKLSFVPGPTYRFDLSGIVGSHPFKFSTSVNGPTEYTTGVTSGSNFIQIEVGYDTTTPLYYYCTNHNGMGNEINVLAIEKLLTTASFNSYTASLNSFSASILSYTSSLNAATSSFTLNSQTSSFVQNSQTGAFATFTSLNAYTSSINSYTNSLNLATSSFVLNSQTSSFVQNSQTSSFATFTALNAYTSSINTYTSSLNSTTSSFVRNSQTSSMSVLSASFAITASFALNAGGSSIDTGSLATTASLNSFSASILSYTSSLNAATSSFVLNSQTSSFVLNSQTSSFIQSNQTSSFVQNSQTGAFATFTALNAYTSSINTYTSSLNSKTSSFATTGSNRFNGNQTITGSLIISSSAAIELSVVGNSVFTGSIDIAGNNNNITSSFVTGSNTLRFVDTDTTTTTNQQIGKIEFFSSDATTPGGSVKAYILASAEDTSPDAYVSIGTDSTTGTATEKLRISSAGNVTITTGSLTVANSAIVTGSLTVTQQINSITIGKGLGDTTNTVIGVLALPNNSTGQYNTALGAETLRNNISGSRNTAVGYQALYGVNDSNTTDDVAIGYNAGGFGAAGSNVLIGSLAGAGGSDGSNITRNVYIGYNAGGNNDQIDNSQGNVYIGYNAGYDINQNNTLIINNQSGSNPLIRGNFSGSLQLNTPLGTSITGSLLVTGSVAITGSVQGNVSALTISTNTASIDLSRGNFFTLTLSGSTHFTATNIKPGQTVNILLTTNATNNSASFNSTIFRQPSGSAYSPTGVNGAQDIITLISYDTTALYMASVKNMI